MEITLMVYIENKGNLTSYLYTSKFEDFSFKEFFEKYEYLDICKNIPYSTENLRICYEPSELKLPEFINDELSILAGKTIYSKSRFFIIFHDYSKTEKFVKEEFVSLCENIYNYLTSYQERSNTGTLQEIKVMISDNRVISITDQQDLKDFYEMCLKGQFVMNKEKSCKESLYDEGLFKENERIRFNKSFSICLVNEYMDKYEIYFSPYSINELN